MTVRIASLLLLAATSASAAPARPGQLDVNGDGYADVIATEVGRIDPIKPPVTTHVLVYFGGKRGPRNAPDLVLGGAKGKPIADWSKVDGIGDVNGDGFSDLLATEKPATGALLANIYLGGPAGPRSEPDLQLATPHGDRDHTTFVPVGDVNGDGFSDVAAAVSCPTGGFPQSKPDHRDCTPGLEALYVYLGSATGLATKPAFAVERAWAGWTAVAALGDFDGDGFDDVLWGTSVHRGSRAGLATTASLALQGPGGAPLEIRSVHPAGDLDHDGFADVIVIGSTGVAKPVQRYLYRGAARPAATPALVEDRPWFGVSAVGDVDGDGIADLLVVGDKARLFAGKRSGVLATTPFATLDGAFEAGVSPGDIDGDGVNDIVLYPPIASLGGGPNRAVVYRGGASVFSAPLVELTGRPGERSFPLHVAGPGIR